MARKEKVTESTSTLESQRPTPSGDEFESGNASSADTGALELVDDPGPVKKIHFEGSPVHDIPAPEPAPTQQAAASGQYRMAAAEERRTVQGTSIYSAQSGVDQLNAPDASFVGAPRKANLEPWRESTTLYRTDRGGEVRAYEGPTGRTLTLADGHRERRFSESEVDQVIQGIELQREAAAQQPQDSPFAESAETVEETKPKRGLFGFGGRKAKAKKAAAQTPIAETTPETGSDYQPQCSAITEEGLQCRNSARGGSKYCSSHFGFQPRTVEGIHQGRDTEPRFESSHDTLPGGAWEPGQGSSQCAAVTKGNKQCQNPVVAGSPYCGSHQSYQEPTGREIVAAADTKPRWSGAKDTKPATRKPAKTASKGSKAAPAKKTKGRK